MFALSPSLSRTLSIACSLCLLVSSSPAAVVGLAGLHWRWQQNVQAGLAPDGFSDVPGPVYLGTNPSRDPTYRGGIWDSQTLSDLQTAALSWGASAEQVGAQASLHAARPGTTGDDSGGGST